MLRCGRRVASKVLVTIGTPCIGASKPMDLRKCRREPEVQRERELQKGPGREVLVTVDTL